MEHTKKTCFKAYLLKKVKEKQGTKGFLLELRPFRSAYNSAGIWIM